MSSLAASEGPSPERLTRQEILSAAALLLTPLGLAVAEGGAQHRQRAVRVAISLADEVDKQLRARK